MRKLLIILIFTSCKSANIITGSFNNYNVAVTSFFDNKYLSDKSYFLYNRDNNILQNDLSYKDNLKAIEEVLKIKGYRRVTETENYKYKIEVNWDFFIPYKTNALIPISSMTGKNIGAFQGEKNYNMQQLNISCREKISNNEIWKVTAENYTSSNDHRYVIRILSYAMKDFIEHNSLSKRNFIMNEDNADFNEYLVSTYPELESVNNLNKSVTKNRYDALKKSIGNPIDLDKFLIAENDFPISVNWNDAIAYSNEIGDGWRLPNKGELNFLFKNKNKIGGFKDIDYWSSTNFDNDGAWLQSFKTGKQNFYYKNNPLNFRLIKSKK